MPINLGSTTTTHGSHPVFISTLISHLMLHQDKRVNLIFSLSFVVQEIVLKTSGPRNYYLLSSQRTIVASNKLE